MRVAAYVKVGFFLLQDVFHLCHVMAGITSDVGHIDVDILHVEILVGRVLHPDDMVVNVAVHGPERLEVSQGLGRLDAADITGVPQLVHVLEEVEKLWHEGAMCVGKDTDLDHFKFTMNPMANTSLNCTLEPSIFTPSAS